jgi:hypothetical protein
MTPRQAKTALNKAYKTEEALQAQFEQAEANTRKVQRELADMVEVKKTPRSYILTRKCDGLAVWMPNYTEWANVYWHKNGKQTKDLATGINANAGQFNWVKNVALRLATYTK